MARNNFIYRILISEFACLSVTKKTTRQQWASDLNYFAGRRSINRMMILIGGTRQMSLLERRPPYKYHGRAPRAYNDIRAYVARV